MAPNPYVKAIAPQAASAQNGTPTPNRNRTPKSAKKSGSAAASPSTNGKGKARADAGLLKAEILALGGDEEDLKMLQDVDSDSEMEGEEDETKRAGKGSKETDGADASLLKDLRAFAKGLDFSAAGATAPASDSEDEVGDEEDDDEGNTEGANLEEDEGEEEEAVQPASVVKAPQDAPAKEKKESKHEREERRRAERDAEKEKELAKKAEERAAKEEKKVVKLPSVKSPWVVDPTPQWYSVPLPAPSASAPKPTPSLVSTLLARGQELLARDNELYASSLNPHGSKGSAPPPPTGLSKADQVFVQQILSTGTSSDRISALLLLVSSSPLHTMSYLDQLAALSRKKSRDESGRAIRSLVDWWRSEGGGSPVRKLRAFVDQPALPTVAVAYEALQKGGKQAASASLSKEDVERCLALFAFEDWFKKWFFQLLQALEQMSVDPLAHPRTLSVMHLSNLLRDKPEQESNILRLLVNKLGDTQRSIASKTSHHLLQVLQTHPGMTSILVREVASLVLRPRTSSAAAPSGSHVRFGDDKAKSKAAVVDHGRDNARYYGVITLNQVMLKKEQGEVAGKMIDVYFEVFGDVLGRLADKEEGESGNEADEADKKVKGAQKRKRDDKRGKQPAEVQQVGAVNEADSKLVAAVLTGINRAFPFATLDEEAFKRRLDTLFRITHTGTFNVSIQALLLIYNVSSAKRSISDRFYRALYASLQDPRLASSSKQALYLNLVFRATKHDQDAMRVMAFVKRLIQLLLGMDVTFVLGALFVVGELMATVPGLRGLVTEPEQGKIKAPEKDGESTPEVARYDGKKREPRFANAQNSCLWELTPLLSHWHPTVVQYASHILHGEPISASSDLEQYSLNTFLDRFVYREAKKSVAAKGSSMMQSGLAGQDRSGRVVMVKGSGAAKGEAAVNSDKFRRKNVHDVPVDQIFFHKYFTSKTTLDSDKAAASQKRKSRRGLGRDDQDGSDSDESIADPGFSDKEDSDFDEDALAAAMGDAVAPADDDEEEGSTDDEMEAEIWKAMQKSMPREKGDDEVLEDDPEAAAEMDSDDEDLAAYDYSDSDDDDAAAVKPTAEAEDEDEEDVPFKSAFDSEEDQDEDDDGFLEVDDDVLGSDDDIPLYGDAAADGSESEEDERAQAKKNKKRKLKHLPLFATADDYAALLGDSDEEGDM
ncbi:hypothetical protein JCM5296_006103 [Sporobolomyces johnsonii]